MIARRQQQGWGIHSLLCCEVSPRCRNAAIRRASVAASAWCWCPCFDEYVVYVGRCLVQMAFAEIIVYSSLSMWLVLVQPGRPMDLTSSRSRAF